MFGSLPFSELTTLHLRSIWISVFCFFCNCCLDSRLIVFFPFIFNFIENKSTNRRNIFLHSNNINTQTSRYKYNLITLIWFLQKQFACQQNTITNSLSLSLFSFCYALYRRKRKTAYFLREKQFFPQYFLSVPNVSPKSSRSMQPRFFFAFLFFVVLIYFIY